MTPIDKLEALMKDVTPALPWDENTKVTSDGLRLALAAANALPDLLKIARAVAQLGPVSGFVDCPFCKGVDGANRHADECPRLLAQRFVSEA